MHVTSGENVGFEQSGKLDKTRGNLTSDEILGSLRTVIQEMKPTQWKWPCPVAFFRWKATELYIEGWFSTHGPVVLSLLLMSSHKRTDHLAALISKFSEESRVGQIKIKKQLYG